MGKLKTIALTAAQRAALEQGYREGTTHAFRVRCQMVLLNSTGQRAAEIADLLGCYEVAVNHWRKRYETEGIAGLRTKPGRGRKPILDAEEDLARVKDAIKAHRQKLSVAKAELETARAKSFSQKTLERYIKNTVAVISASANVPPRSRRRKLTP